MKINLHNNLYHRHFRGITALTLSSLIFLLGGCGEDTENNGGDTTNEQECTSERDGWQWCVDDQIQWCHATAEDPHHHWGLDCGALGYQCHQTEDHQAFCLDPERTCGDDPAGFCDENTAHNCIDGLAVVQPCGSALECLIHHERAECHTIGEEDVCGGHGHLHDDQCHCDDGYERDPYDPTKCIPEGEDEECGGHGHLHGDHCHCDDGYDQDPEDPTNCVPESNEE